jgi:hypothetical protein
MQLTTEFFNPQMARIVLTWLRPFPHYQCYKPGKHREYDGFLFALIIQPKPIRAKTFPPNPKHIYQTAISQGDIDKINLV